MLQHLENYENPHRKKLCPEMDVHEAEQEFAQVAFSILGKDALIEILKQMDPIAVLSLCQSNQNFARICREQQTFITLMEAHYPGFPINRDAKAQYGAIAAGEGVTYSIPILPTEQDKKQGFIISDVENSKHGLRFRFGRVATLAPNAEVPQLLCKRGTNEVPSTANFKILGTRIRKGEKVWLLVRHNPCRIDARVFPTRDDALDAIRFLNNDEDFDTFETLIRRNVVTALSAAQRSVKVRLNVEAGRERPVATDEQMNRYLEIMHLPQLPLTRERVRRHVADQGFILVAPTIPSMTLGQQTARENLTRTQYQWFEVEIE